MENFKRPEIFTGTHPRTIDDKNRIIVPTRYRTQLERSQEEFENFYIFCIPQKKAIRIYTYDGWTQFAQSKIDAIPDPIKRQKFTEEIYALLEEGTIDSQGRIKISKEFLKAVDIEKNVILSGIGRGLQIVAAKDSKNPFEVSEETASFINEILF